MLLILRAAQNWKMGHMRLPCEYRWSLDTWVSGYATVTGCSVLWFAMLVCKHFSFQPLWLSSSEYLMQALLNFYETAWLSVAELSLRKFSLLFKGVIFAFTYILYLKMHSFFLGSKHFVCFPVTFLNVSPLLFFSLRGCKEHIIRYRVISGLLGCRWLKWL